MHQYMNWTSGNIDYNHGFCTERSFVRLQFPSDEKNSWLLTVLRLGLQESKMRLLDFHDDMLALIVAKLYLCECVVLMRVCKRTRDLLGGAAMVARIAHAMFVTPLDGGKDAICFPAHGTCGVYLRNTRYLTDDRFACGDWHDPRLEKMLVRALVKIVGVERSLPRVMEVVFWCETRMQAGPASRGPQAVWQDDNVRMWFKVTAEGTVPAVTINFTKGFAQRRAVIVGRVLQEVDPSKAELLTHAFAMCEDAHPGEDMQLKADGGVVYIPKGSSEEHGVGVAIRAGVIPNGRPASAMDTMQVDLAVL